jgi:hypothetical protein
VKQGAVGLGNRGSLLHREDHAGLVIGPHEGDNGRIVINGPLVLIHIQTADTVHPDFGNPVTLLTQVATLGQYRWVLDPAGDDMTTVRQHLQGRADGGVVALGAAGGKDDLVRGGPQQFGHPLAGFGNLTLHLTTEKMH